MIPWRPIAELPEALKDGREVLVGWWDRKVGGTSNPQPDQFTCTTVQWTQYRNGFGKWELSHSGTYAEDGDIYGEPEFFAEITPPR